MVEAGEIRDWGPKTGTEARKSFVRWLDDGFIGRYLSGGAVLDVGYKGYQNDAHPILPWAIGVDLDYPGYDGSRLPFADNSQDAVFNSHVLEHITDYRQAIADWFRVVRVGGHLIIIVPHQFLYERSAAPPSRWNGDHKRFYTAGSLLREVEEAVNPIRFRVRHLEDNDRDFDYSIPPEKHAGGCYEIILVLEKIAPVYYTEELFAPLPPIPTMPELMAMDDPKFVNACYRVFLRRPPDPEGYQSYIEDLRAGRDRMEICSTFATSAEARDRNIPVPDDIKAIMVENDAYPE